MQIFPVITHKNKSLRERSVEIERQEIGTPEFQAFLDALIETMKVKDGIGIAAPQVATKKRIFIAHVKGEDHVFINPEIAKTSDKTVETEEGCLSVPGVYGMVTRPKKIRIKAMDRHAREFVMDLKNMDAVVCQHESDHLDGILFVDKMTKITRGTWAA